MRNGKINEQLAIGNWQLAMGKQQLTIGNGQWAMNNRQWSIDNGQLAIDKTICQLLIASCLLSVRQWAFNKMICQLLIASCLLSVRKWAFNKMICQLLIACCLLSVRKWAFNKMICQLLIASCLLSVRKWAFNKMICQLLIACCLFSISAEIFGQDTVPINLQTILELGGADNLTIKEYQQRQELAMADLSKAREWWLPEVYAGLQNHRQWGAAMNADGRFFLDVDRQNLWTGIGVNAKWNIADGIYLTKAANLKTQAAQHLSQAERNKALLETIEAYYDFLAAQLYFNAYEQLSEQAETIIQQVEVQVQAGMRYESELLLSKSNLNHLRIEKLNARADYLKKSAHLVRLLNFDPQSQLTSVNTVLTPLNLNLSETDNFENAYASRPELKAGELNFKSLQTERKTTTTALLFPQLQIGAFASQFGRGLQPVKPMFPQEYPNPQAMYPTSALDVSLMWRIPIGRLVYAGELKQFNTRLKLQETQIEQQKAQVNEEILSARAQLTIAQQQIEIAREGLQFSATALEQNIQRQELGLVRPFEILQTQEVFIKSQLDFLKSVTAYNKSQYRLMVAKGGNL